MPIRTFKSTITIFTLACLGTILSACALGPDYQRPQMGVIAGDFVNAPTEEREGSSSYQWWSKIDDPVLNSYVDQLLAQNLNLKEAAARVMQARARLSIERGDYLPSVDLNTIGSRSFTPSASVPSGRAYTNSYTAELESAWQIDLFGRIGRSVEGADANYQAAAYDHLALKHSLIAELLNRRIAIAVNKRLLELAQDNADNRQKIYDLVKNRYDLGVQGAGLDDVLLAEENLTTVQADINAFRRRLNDEAYAFDVLLGHAPGTTDISTTSAFPLLPAPLDVPVCMPASLLDRRPDLKASELRIKAANANIGVAIADLYPNITLGGSLGFTGASAGGLFNAD